MIRYEMREDMPAELKDIIATHTPDDYMDVELDEDYDVYINYYVIEVESYTFTIEEYIDIREGKEEVYIARKDKELWDKLMTARV